MRLEAVAVRIATKPRMYCGLAWLVLGLGFVQCISYIEEVDWHIYKETYGKSYRSEDENKLRQLIFGYNKKHIDEHNRRFHLGEVTFEMAVNQFTDTMREEFEDLMLHEINVTEALSLIELTYSPRKNEAPPDSVDWRQQGAVTGVKNQGLCGSCWAFSAVGTLEGQVFLHSNTLTSLSEQNLLDCSSRKPYNNHGCDGGSPTAALKYVCDNGGIDTKDSYAYEGKQQDCRFDQGHIGGTVRDVVRVPVSEEMLTSTVASKGPVSVCIHVSDNFKNYNGGVLMDDDCNKAINHAVVVVGYGRDDQFGDYWLVKNSWGSAWGEGGYIRMARNRNNQCRIASLAVFPIV